MAARISVLFAFMLLTCPVLSQELRVEGEYDFQEWPGSVLCSCFKDGNVVACGRKDSSTIVLFCFSPQGGILWKNYFEMGAEICPRSITVSGQNFAIAGQKPGLFSREAFLVLVDRNGQKLWQKSFGWGIGNLDAYGICREGDFYFLAGYQNNSQGFLLKADLQGNLIWCRDFGNPQRKEWIWSMAPANFAGRRGFVMAGGAGPGPADSMHDIWLVFTDLEGRLLLEKTIGATADNEYARSVSQLPSGGFFVAGQVSFSGNVDSNALAVWTDKGGNLVSCWSFRQSVFVASSCYGNKILAAGFSNTNLSGIGQQALVACFNEEGRKLGIVEFGGIADERIISALCSDDFIFVGGDLDDDFSLAFAAKIGNPGFNIASPDKPLFSPSTRYICAGGNKADFQFLFAGGVPSGCSLELVETGLPGEDGSLAAIPINRGNFLCFDYLSPRGFCRSGHPEDANARWRMIEIVLKQNGVWQRSEKIRLYRSPLVLIHGLWGDANGWDKFKELFSASGLYPDALVYTHDYEENNASGFIANRDVCGHGLDSAILKAEMNGFCVQKADLVAHSMGGVLARIYLQGLSSVPYRGDVLRLITLGTPHSGSSMADYIMSDLGLQLSFDSFGHPTGNGAVYDLRVNSPLLDTWLNGQSLQANQIPCFSICGRATVYQGSAWEIIAYSWDSGILAYWLPQQIFHEDNDLVVSVSSQAGGANREIFDGVSHLELFNSEAVFERVMELLNTSPADPIFSKGFRPPDLQYFGILNSEKSSVKKWESYR